MVESVQPLACGGLCRLKRGARWDEMDLETREWRIPAERMKANRDHRVPLSTGALAVLREARNVVTGSDLVFPSVRGRRLSDATISKMVRELGIGAVPHGFRSSFRDWAAECSDAPPRGVRAGAGPCELGPGGGRLPADGPLRAAPRTHGRVGVFPGVASPLQRHFPGLRFGSGWGHPRPRAMLEGPDPVRRPSGNAATTSPATADRITGASGDQIRESGTPPSICTVRLTCPAFRSGLGPRRLR